MMISQCYKVPSSNVLSQSYAMSAPFNHLLTSNGPPSPEDAHNLRTYLSYPKNRVIEIRRRVELLRIEMAALNAEQDTMGERYAIDQHEAILSSIRRLPTSVLQTVFIYGVLAAESVMETHFIIIVLSRVCRRWRAAVLQTPALHATAALGMSQRLMTYFERVELITTTHSLVYDMLGCFNRAFFYMLSLC
ncbi:hypothetical protein CPB85DRAFT_1282956 [Mucidula mucida]|nr:hypothetical protein CPB85DRAFT_1282956 [Mucidula mucida]